MRMGGFVTGGVIRTLRERKGYTQKQLAEMVMVSDKAVSKWETGKGLPDISLIEPLSKALGVSVAELLSGEMVENRNRGGNMLRGSFYVCPVCGNVIHAVGKGAFSCCGVTLPVLEAENADADHGIRVEKIESDHYVTVDHPMTRSHYLSFFAYVTSNRVQFVKLYPEQDAEARFSIAGRGEIYAYCNRHGLFSVRV
jgi:desulfoferrodoxin (superoxide reductase-like protein)/DNA-binding XRE family transcriptional regulator